MLYLVKCQIKHHHIIINTYKSKTFNPGSPAPNPLKDQFSSFPALKTSCQEFTSYSPDPKNPLKVTFSSVRKRKSRDDDSEEEMSSPKKTRIDEQFQSLQDFMKTLSKKMDDSKKEISDKLDKVNENIEDFKEFKTHNFDCPSSKLVAFSQDF